MTANKKADPLGTLLSNHGWQLVLSAMLLFSVLAPASIAQNKKISTSQPAPPPPPRKKYNNDNEYVPTQLKDPPDLPFLPPYSGALYSNILSFNRMPGKPGYSLTFHVKDPPDVVIAFYKNAFKNNSWKTQKGGDSDKMASGMRKGAAAVVNVMKPIVKGYKTQVYLVYKIYGKIQ